MPSLTPMNKVLKHITLPIIAMIWLAVSASCGSARKATSGHPTSQGQTTASISHTQWERQLADIASSYGTWERMRLPVKVDIQSPKNISVSGNAVMVRNKCIHISLRTFGIEIGWLYLTADSVTVVDKYHKQYVSEGIASFLANAPLTIANVQDVLLGRMFEIGQSTSLTSAQVSRGEADCQNSLYCFIPRIDGSSPFSCGFSFIPSASELSPFAIANAVIGGAARPVNVSYGPTLDTPSGPMASECTLAFDTDKSHLEAALRWNFSKARWNNDVQIPAMKVAGYTRISLNQIMSLIQKL